MSDFEVNPHVDRAFEALDDRDADAVAAEFAPDGTFYEIPRDEAFSKQEFREYLADEVFVTFPDYRVEEWTAVTTADWATTVQWSFAGTHEGRGGWVEPTGNAVSLPVVSVLTVSADGISSWRDFFDPRTLFEQLGIE